MYKICTTVQETFTKAGYNSKTFSTEFTSNSDINFLHSNHNIFSNNDQGPAKGPHEARVQFQETDAAFCKAQRTAGYVILLLDLLPTYIKN